MRSEDRNALVELIRLIGQPEPERWVDKWIEEPHPRLGGQRPSQVCINRSSRLRVYSIAAVDADPNNQQ